VRRHTKQAKGPTEKQRRRISPSGRFALAILSLGGLLCIFGPSVASAASGSLFLPDNRAYEQVSPVNKNGSNIESHVSVAATGGNGLFFTSPGSFAGNPTAQFNGNGYLSRRGSDRWTTGAIQPPGGELSFNSTYLGFSADLGKGVFQWVERSPQFGTLDPDAVPGQNLYMRDNVLGSFTLLNGTLDENGVGFGGFAWGTPDFGKLAFQSEHALTPDSPCTEGEYCSYEWEGGTLRLASILPNEEPVQGHLGAEAPGQAGSVENVVSDDGSRVFFTGPSAPLDSPPRFYNELYVREDGASTSLISASERTLPGGFSGNDVFYQAAEAGHGDRVLFTTRNALVDADTDETNDLYLYDFIKPVGERLTLVSKDRNPGTPDGAQVDGTRNGQGGVLARSEDLSRIYFVTDNQILPGEPENFGPKLYLWDDTGSSPEVTYIATLAEGDERDWASQNMLREGPKNSRPSRDGRFVAFLSTAKLTPFENEGAIEIYRYDALAPSLVCVSCASDAFPASGEISFGGSQGAPANHLLNNTSDSGQVFFETSRGLLPKDSNGKVDVYQYEDGQLHLISRGTGSRDSIFLDATPSGSDVFFTTGDQLVGWDNDGLIDAYDARVNGGLPEPPLPPPPCEGDSCQPPPNMSVDPSLASASFNGPGDPSARKRHARRCAKGKVHRHGKCRKRGRKAPRHRKHTATRSHG